MPVAGSYEVVTKSPMGDQKSILTIHVDGSSFSGSNVGAMGSIEITGGTVNGHAIAWTSQIISPMPLKLDCKAQVDADTITGTVTVGMFGSFPMNGTRIG